MLKKIMFWPKTTSILKNEEGAVIIAALLVLVLLTIIGIASTNISNTEVKIAAHEADSPAELLSGRRGRHTSSMDDNGREAQSRNRGPLRWIT